MKNTVAT